MSPTPAEILVLIAPHLASDPNKSLAIALAERNVPSDIDETRRPECVAYLAAHHMTQAGAFGAAGGVTAKTEGGLSVSYGGSGGATGLKATSYGQTYHLMVNALRGGSVLAVGLNDG